MKESNVVDRILSCLNETPDIVTGWVGGWHDADAIPFKVYDNGEKHELLIGKKASTHADGYRTKVELPKNYKAGGYDAGRLWTKAKVISTYHRPSAENFKMLCKALEGTLGIKIDSSWHVDFPENDREHTWIFKNGDLPPGHDENADNWTPVQRLVNFDKALEFLGGGGRRMAPRVAHKL